MSEVRFDDEGVLEQARQAAGLEDFGDPGFREGLHALLRTYDENPYSEKGRKRNWRRVVQLQRLTGFQVGRATDRRSRPAGIRSR